MTKAKSQPQPEDARLAGEHEAGFANSFVEARRRSRVLEFLASPKNRPKITRELYHCNFLDRRWMKGVVPNEHYAPQVAAKLKLLGASDRCYLISSGSDLDGRFMDLEEALSDVIGFGNGTFISCIPGKLGYFEFEDMGERYLLIRP